MSIRLRRYIPNPEPGPRRRHRRPFANADVDLFLDELRYRIPLLATGDCAAGSGLVRARRQVAAMIADLGRGREAWLAQELLDRVIRSFEGATPEELVRDDLEQALIDAVDALIVRDTIPLDLAGMYRIGFHIVAPADLPEDSLANLLKRCPRPLATVLRWTRERAGEPKTRILLQRSIRTLQEIADEIGLTRERIRQYETTATRIAEQVLDDIAPEVRPWWREQLQSIAASEETLLGTLGAEGERVSDELLLGRALLRAMAARAPAPLAQYGIRTWWTLRPSAMTEALEALATMLPCRPSSLADLLADYPLSAASAIEAAIRAGAGGFRYHPGGDIWVRANSQDRDASWLILQERGASLHAEELAQMLGLRAHALDAQLRRDERLVAIRPSGLWALAAWEIETTRYATTIEACLDVLEERGPLALAELTQAIQDRYPVTGGAVLQCLNHSLVGRWPDGRIDLVARGASRIERKEPRPSSDVLPLPNGLIAFTREVDEDVLRGSGLGVSPYLTWLLGLVTAPSVRTFNVPGHGDIQVRYGISGSNVSTLRDFAETLEARIGCRLTITLDDVRDTAGIALTCVHHHSRVELP